MVDGSYPTAMVKRIDVPASDVRVVGWRTALGPDPKAPQTGPGAWLRRYRMRIAGMLALTEAILWAFDVSKLVLLASAVAILAFHFLVTPKIRSYFVYQVSWTLAFAQALVAVGTLLLFAVSAVVALIVFGALVVLVLGGLAMLLGQRR